MPFLGEIRLFAGSIAPLGWAFCDGSDMPIDGNEDLFSLIGAAYGDGVYFRLPDFRSRTFMHLSADFLASGIGIRGGLEEVTISELPSHSHPAGCNGVASNTSTVSGSLFATGPTIYFSGTPATSRLSSLSTAPAGGGLPHSNISPYIALNYIICIAGGVPPVAGASIGGSFSSLGGMLMLAAFTITPAGWARLDGDTFVRATDTGLFSLIGVTFGAGNGTTTAGLPNLLNRTINGAGSGSGLTTYAVGDLSGEAQHTLTLTETPAHAHDFHGVSDAGDSIEPTARLIAAITAGFQTGVNGDTMDASMIAPTGTASPVHDNVPPFLGGSAFIALDDVTPDHNTGDILIGPFASAPSGYQALDGSSLTVSGHGALFAVIGYTYGGSGANFNVPDARGRIAVGAGRGLGLSSYALAETGGTETVALSTSQIPAHGHAINVVSGRLSGQSGIPTGNLLCSGLSYTPYRASGTDVTLNADAIRSAGSGAAHENRPPACAMNLFIKL